MSITVLEKPRTRTRRPKPPSGRLPLLGAPERARSKMASGEGMRAVGEPRRLWARHLFLGSLFLIAQVLFLHSQLFRVRHLYVSGNTHVLSQEILKTCAVAKGSYLWTMSPAELARRVGSLYTIENAEVHFGLPGRVEIIVHERQPVLQVSARSTRPKWFLVDKEGVVLRSVALADQSLPRLMVEEQLRPGQRIHRATMFSCATAAAEVEKFFPGKVWYYCVDSRGNISFRTFANRAQVDVQLGNMKGIPYKMQVLGALLREVASKQRITAIDLRYGSPVVKLLNPPKPKE